MASWWKDLRSASLGATSFIHRSILAASFFMPRGMKKEAARIDLWMKDVAPSDALRKSLHHEAMKWPDFLKKYQAELQKKKPWLAELKKLEKEHGTLTLLFGARD